jgi:uncharacterized protein YjbJ (UPF0337 family)
MISSQELEGKWTTIRGKVKEKWGQLTDDDLHIASGNVDQLVGRIQQKTGETKQRIEAFFNDLVRGEGVAGFANQARETAQQVGHQVADRARDGYRRAEHMVQEHPASSMAGVFVGGLLAGVCIGLMLSSNNR